MVHCTAICSNPLDGIVRSYGFDFVTRLADNGPKTVCLWGTIQSLVGIVLFKFRA